MSQAAAIRRRKQIANGMKHLPKSKRPRYPVLVKSRPKGRK